VIFEGLLSIYVLPDQSFLPQNVIHCTKNNFAVFWVHARVALGSVTFKEKINLNMAYTKEIKWNVHSKKSLSHCTIP
jgi:hypothetical protein